MANDEQKAPLIDPLLAAAVLKALDLGITIVQNRNRNLKGQLEEYIAVRDALRKALVQQAVDLISEDPIEPEPEDTPNAVEAERETLDVPTD